MIGDLVGRILAGPAAPAAISAIPAPRRIS
jgi:hypothetical protein